MTQINRSEHPDYFYESSTHEDQADEKGFTQFLTIKDPELINLRDSLDSSAAESLRVILNRCRNDTQSSIVCASDQEIELKVGNTGLHITSLINFVEYEEVEPGIGPIKRIAKTVTFDAL